MAPLPGVFATLHPSSLRSPVVDRPEITLIHPSSPEDLVQCAALFCTYPVTVAEAALARVTLARMSVALAVQMKGLGSML